MVFKNISTEFPQRENPDKVTQFSGDHAVKQ